MSLLKFSNTLSFPALVVAFVASPSSLLAKLSHRSSYAETDQSVHQSSVQLRPNRSVCTSVQLRPNRSVCTSSLLEISVHGCVFAFRCVGVGGSTKKAQGMKGNYTSEWFSCRDFAVVYLHCIYHNIYLYEEKTLRIVHIYSFMMQVCRFLW